MIKTAGSCRSEASAELGKKKGKKLLLFLEALLP
jgi:hypothetical protein